MKVSAAFARLLQGKNLNSNHAYGIFKTLFEGRFSENQSKALLLLLARKGETADELLGCLKALRSLEPYLRTGDSSIMDTCGTGGDHSGSLNISTLAALVIAGAGGKVAKHGNKGISSRCGSSDLMEALGIDLTANPPKMLQAIDKAGIAYFHAPFYHPVFSRVQALRKKLATRTLFNLLGPLTNPVQLTAQLIGVSSKRHLKLYSEVFKKLRQPRTVLVCRSLDGMDEISTSADTEIAWIQKGKVRKGFIRTRDHAFPKCQKKDFAGGDARQNSKTARLLLQNKIRGPVRDIVILNAAAGLWVLGRTKNLKQGIRAAEDSLTQGKALQALICLQAAASSK